MTGTTAAYPELGIEGIEWPDLFDRDVLRDLDQRFLQALRAQDAGLHAMLLEYRQGGIDDPVQVSELLVRAAPVLESFVTQLFDIAEELSGLAGQAEAEKRVARFKAEFVQRRARRYKGSGQRAFGQIDAAVRQRVTAAGIGTDDYELAVATLAVRLLEEPEQDGEAIDELTEWCVAAQEDADGVAAVAGWSSFDLPRQMDYGCLVPLQPVPGDAAARMQAQGPYRQRDGFNLSDPRMDARGVFDQIHYCVWCHDHDGDFCSKGFPKKKNDPDAGLKVNPLGETLTGCPLGEKISEMHLLKRDGYAIAALAVVMIDNPTVPATGHRICNDCMKSCIYQKKEPVDIPQIETRVLTDVLELTWGVEIYDLLTRWNPLRSSQYLPQAPNGRRVLIAGMGPAGFTMAHYLTMEGCTVVGIEGLKVESLPDSLLREPVRDYSQIHEQLGERVMAGFGGVAEYGITVRWDKNFLRLVYLSLARRDNFQVFGGVRLGGTVTLEDAWELGFDHVCIATGAGLPRVLPMKNSLARGMRQASDFLMALQLTGAAREQSLANLQVRLPAVVIGGGLTAIDTATEVQVYYVAQVEKLHTRHARLVELYGEQAVVGRLCEEDRGILSEMLAHAGAIRAERERAKAAGTEPDLVSLVRGWGGVTVVYRRGLNESPAYLRNHEEVVKAMDEGIYYAEGLEPCGVRLDGFGHVESLVCRRMQSKQGRWLATTAEAELEAKAVFVAAGAFPNTIYEREYPGTFKLDGHNFLPHVGGPAGLQAVDVAPHCKAPEFGPFTSYSGGRHRVSFIGDTHPVFHGSVVKAIASAMRSYPEVMQELGKLPAVDVDAAPAAGFLEHMQDLFTPRVASISQDIPGVVELWIRAPMAARNFQAGQFFRLQTFERGSEIIDGTRMQIPLLTVSGAGVVEDRIRLMVLQGAPLPRLARLLQPGDPLVLMGPTGEPTVPVLGGETVMVIAQMWGAAVMLSLGGALRAAGKRVVLVYLAQNASQVYHREELEQAADQIVWCTSSGPAVDGLRDDDVAIEGDDILQMLEQYRMLCTEPGREQLIAPGSIDSVLVMGATGILRALQDALHTDKFDLFRQGIDIYGAVGSPMQCMLKGVCAQCAQWQLDPETGERTRPVFGCAMQDQPLQWIDLDNMVERLTQNRLADSLSWPWVDHLLEQAAEK